MLKLALIGKDISHSKSEQVYRNLLNIPFEYDLLDFQSQSDIPSAKELLQSYDGVSITAPYKNHFIGEVDDTSKLGIINILRKGPLDSIEGANTDFLAVENIIDRYLNSAVKDIRILGNGAMAYVCEIILKNRGVNFQQYSRNQNNLTKLFDSEITPDFSTLVINTCARDYIFKDSSTKGYHFWDMNYQMPEHQKHFSKLNIAYTDGLEQLILQAKYSLSFWNLIKI